MALPALPRRHKIIHAARLALVAAAALVACGDATSPDADASAEADADGPACADTVKYPLDDPQRDPESYGMRWVPEADDFDASLCRAFCEMADLCGDDFGDCDAHCAALVDGGRAGDAACYLADCRQREACLEGAPVGELQGCPELCAEIEACPAMALLRLTPSEAGCRTMCAGRGAAFSTFAEALPCFVRAARSCDLDEALACLRSGESYCPAACVAADGCADDTPLDAVWPDGATCLAECGARTAPEALNAAQCVERAGCQADRACMDGAPAICDDYYAAAATVCEADGSWPPSFTLLTASCDQLRFADVEDVTGVAACLEATGCHRLGERLCLEAEAPDPRCDDLCAALCACGLLDHGECLRECESSIGDQAEDVDRLAGCVATGACEPMDACLAELLTGGDEADAGLGACRMYCDGLETCGDGDDDGCEGRCADRLAAGDVAPLSSLGCWSPLGCEGFSACEATPPPILAACEAACADATAACAGVPVDGDAGRAACAAGCSGLMSAWGATSADAAACAADSLDAECRPAAVIACAPEAP